MRPSIIIGIFWKLLHSWQESLKYYLKYNNMKVWPSAKIVSNEFDLNYRSPAKMSFYDPWSVRKAMQFFQSDLTPLVSNSTKPLAISVSNEFDLNSPPIFLYSIIINTTHLHFLWNEFNDLWLTRLAAELGHTCNNRRVEWPIERIYERRRFEAHHSQAAKEGHPIDSWGYYIK